MDKLLNVGKGMFLLALMLVCACDKSEGGEMGDDQRVAASFTTGIDMKVDDKVWDSGDQLGVYMVDYTNNVESGEPFEEYSNLLHTISNTAEAGVVSSAYTMYYPIDGSEVGFYAYYPYSDEVGEDFKYSLDVGDQSVPSLIDFMESSGNKGYSKTNASVALTFVHRMARFGFEIEMGEGMDDEPTQDITVSISGVNIKADYNLATNEFENYSGSDVDFAPYTITAGESYQCILFPETFSAGAKVTFHTSVGDLSWDLEGIGLYWGQTVTYPVTINRTAVNVRGPSTIVGWVDREVADSEFTAE